MGAPYLLCQFALEESHLFALILRAVWKRSIPPFASWVSSLLCEFKHLLLGLQSCAELHAAAASSAVMTPLHAPFYSSPAFVLPLWVLFEWRLGRTATALYGLQTLPLLCCCSLYAFLRLPPPTRSSPAAACRGLLREIMMSASLRSLCLVPALPGWRCCFAQMTTLS